MVSFVAQPYQNQFNLGSVKQTGRGDTLWDRFGKEGAINTGIARDVSGRAGGWANNWGQAGQQFLDTFKTQGMPAMSQQMDYARDYASPTRMIANRSAAMGGARTAQQAAMANAADRLRAYGVSDPSTGRGAGATRAGDIIGGANVAAAGQQSDRQTEMMGQALLDNAIKNYMTLPGFAQGAAGVGLAAGNQQINAPLAAIQTEAATRGTPLQWETLGMDTLGKSMEAGIQEARLKLQEEAMKNEQGNGLLTGLMGGAGFLNNIFGSGGMFAGSLGNIFGSAAGGAGAAGAGALGSGAGSVTGIASGAASALPFLSGGMMPRFNRGGKMRPQRPRKFRANRFEAEDYIAQYARGGMGPQGAIDTGLGTPGVTVPYSASPSGGAVEDDVNARVGPGEFIVPEDVTSWKGEQFFQKMIAKSREEMAQGREAEPTMKKLPPNERGAPPSFVSPGGANDMAEENAYG